MRAESPFAPKIALRAAFKPFGAVRTNVSAREGGLATLGVLLAAYGVVAWIWLVSDSAWFHVELFTVSEHVWGGALAASFGAKLRSVFDWRVFDISPYRLRMVSDFVEIIDATTRPASRTILGLHPSATPLGLAIAAATLAFFYRALRLL